MDWYSAGRTHVLTAGRDVRTGEADLAAWSSATMPAVWIVCAG
jgi:hypothetical protein